MKTNDNNSNSNRNNTLNEWRRVNNSKTGNSTNAPKPSDIVNQKNKKKEVSNNYQCK